MTPKNNIGKQQSVDMIVLTPRKLTYIYQLVMLNFSFEMQSHIMSSWLFSSGIYSYNFFLKSLKVRYGTDFQISEFTNHVTFPFSACKKSFGCYASSKNIYK